MKTFVISEGMQILDWLIVGTLFAFLLMLLFFCQKFVKNSADFLAANRCARRYVLSISTGIAGFAVVNSVASFEMFYQAGFSSQWWSMLSAPVGLALSLVAWVSYRMRETRCFTVAQFFEVRYSRRFRICAGILTWLSGIVNYGIFPAVSVRFFMFFCRLPDRAMFLGVNWDVYAVLLTFALSMGVLFAVCGGQIAVMVTDFAQGVFCNIAFLVFILFIFNLGRFDIFGGFVSWEKISFALQQAPEGMSQINPFASTKIPDFNIYYFLIGIFGAIYARGSWQGGMGYAAAAKTPHESKMAGILGTWRGMAQGLMILLFPLAVIAIMKHPDFADLAAKVTETLSQTSDLQLRKQGLVPTALSLIMPTGLLGLFVAVMAAAMLSTDDTYMHSWGSIFIQDVIMPFRKKPFTAKQHIWALRGSILFVAIFAWLFSYFFRQTEYVFMFFAITGAIVSGAGAAIIGGLYWKKGGTFAAWVSYIAGAGIAVTGIVLQQTWHFADGSGMARYLADHYKWQWVTNHMEKFPVNGQWVVFIGYCSCMVLYIVISLIEHHVFKKPAFNLEKMLHRGAYDKKHEHQQVGIAGKLAKRLGITNEFTLGDKLIYFATLAWTFVWFGVFLWFTLQNLFWSVPDSQWMVLWRTKVYVSIILSVIVTIWFLIGGIKDVILLFTELRSAERNDSDNGSVSAEEQCAAPAIPLATKDK